MKFPIEMYRIREEDMKIKVPCERCLEKGIVNQSCHRCGGNGTHNKTIKVWKVAPRTVTVEKIDRASKDSYYKGVQTSYVGGLRYWTGASDFFNEEDKYLHFNKNDAQEECDKRNVDIADILKIHKQEKQKMTKYFCDRVGCGKEITKEVAQLAVFAHDGFGSPIVCVGLKHMCEECVKKFEQVKDKLEHEEDFLNMTDEDIELLRYTFNVGDKVIASDGLTGTVTAVCTCSECKRRGFYELTIEMKDGSVDYVMATDKKRGFDAYYSIGDRVFGNLDEEYVTNKMNDTWKQHKQLVKQLGLIKTLKEKGWSANEI